MGLIVLFALSPGIGLGLALGGVALMRFGVTGDRPPGRWGRPPTRAPLSPSATVPTAETSDGADLGFDRHRPRDLVAAAFVLVPLAVGVIALAAGRAHFHVTSA